MALNWSKLALLFIAMSILALPCCVILLAILSQAAPEMPQPIDTSTPQQPDHLQALTNLFIPTPETTNVSGFVMNDIGQPAVNVNVTLWRDGKIADIPNNPQRTTTGWNGSRYQPNKVGIFLFPDVPNVDYVITCEKDDYVMNYSWDPRNPIPIPIVISKPGANPNYTKQKYYNITNSQIEAAKALASDNQSVCQLLNGTDYSIEYVTTASDETTPLVLKISYLIGTYNYTEGHITVNSHLLVCVDLTHQRIVTIQQNYDGTDLGNYWTRTISPGSYVYFLLKVYDVNGSLQEHPVNLSLSCIGDGVVRPMVLDAPNFGKFENGEPYQIYLYGDRVVSSEWSGNFSMLSNLDYYYVLKNEDLNKTAKVKSMIDLSVWDPVLTCELGFDAGPGLYHS